MKEIGEKLKETRENMGISIEEAAEDLKLRPSQLENIEEGNREAFKDVFYMKHLSAIGVRCRIVLLVVVCILLT